MGWRDLTQDSPPNLGFLARMRAMKRKPNPELVDAENPEWTAEDFQRARPAAEVLPELVGQQLAAELLKPRGRPKAAVTKTHVNIRLDADVLKAFKATGRGWQTRINKALRDWLKTRNRERIVIPGGRDRTFISCR
jgi:uncharacterized protein (DUF4415 family)